MINKFRILNGTKYFFRDVSKLFTTKKGIKYFSGTTRIDSWKSNRISEENIEDITESDCNFAPTFLDHYLLPDINFNECYLMQHNASIPPKIINLYISYTLNSQLRNLNTDFTSGNCLFRSVKVAKNAELDKYKFSSCTIGFDSPSEFLLPDGSMEKKFIIFGADMSSSVHVDNNGKDILILGEGPTQESYDTTLTTEAKYPINFIQSGKRFVLGLY